MRACVRVAVKAVAPAHAHTMGPIKYCTRLCHAVYVVASLALALESAWYWFVHALKHIAIDATDRVCWSLLCARHRNRN